MNENYIFKVRGDALTRSGWAPASTSALSCGMCSFTLSYPALTDAGATVRRGDQSLQDHGDEGSVERNLRLPSRPTAPPIDNHRGCADDLSLERA